MIISKYKSFCYDNDLEDYPVKEFALILGLDLTRAYAVLELWIDVYPDKLIEMHNKKDPH